MSKEARTVDVEIVEAWRTAATDLAIKVTAPFTILTETGQTETFEALIHEFGGPKGTVIGRISAHDSTKSRTTSGYYSSNLSDAYRRHDREYFISTLDDWKWYGSHNQQPSWYTGRNWS